MSLEKIFDVVDKLHSTASADAAFGAPQEVEGRVLIPVACVATGLGVGFGSGIPEDEMQDKAPQDAGATATPGEQEGSEGGGGGGGARSRPVAVIEVTESETIVRPIVDETVVALAGIALAGWTVFCLLVTLRAVFGKKPQGK
jgi:uncharacterized spore protein YtfJ